MSDRGDHVRRETPRYEIAEALVGETRYASSIRLVDLSASGALIEHTRFYKPGSEIALHLPLDAENLRVRASVVHCTVHGVERGPSQAERTTYRSGIRFLDLSEHGRERIGQMIVGRMASERREQPRLYVGCPARVEEEIDIRALNLGRRGGLFSVRYPLEFSSEHELRFRLPAGEVRVRGVIRHCQAWAHARGEPRFQVGVEFLAFRGNGEELVLQYLANLDQDRMAGGGPAVGL